MKIIYHDNYIKNGLIKIGKGEWFKDKDYIHKKGKIIIKKSGKIIKVINL